MKRLVIDTNALVSALLFRGTASRLHAHWKSGSFTLLVNHDILLEYARVLAYPKFRLSEMAVSALLETEVLGWCEVIEVSQGPAVCVDSSDDKFLWCAREGKADALVSGDQDLLDLAPSWEGTAIWTVRDALRRLDSLSRTR